MALKAITLTVNGLTSSLAVEPRRSLLDCLRDDLQLKGTHAGCEHGVCGCCNVLLNGEVVRACLLLAAQADGAEITTVEGLETPDGLSPLQEAFCEFHALQCGYCTPGFLMTLLPFLQDHPNASEKEIRTALSGNLCRCTGYQNIILAATKFIEKNTGNGRLQAST